MSSKADIINIAWTLITVTGNGAIFLTTPEGNRVAIFKVVMGGHEKLAAILDLEPMGFTVQCEALHSLYCPSDLLTGREAHILAKALDAIGSVEKFDATIAMLSDGSVHRYLEQNGLLPAAA